MLYVVVKIYSHSNIGDDQKLDQSEKGSHTFVINNQHNISFITKETLEANTAAVFTAHSWRNVHYEPQYLM